MMEGPKKGADEARWVEHGRDWRACGQGHFSIEKLFAKNKRL